MRIQEIIEKLNSNKDNHGFQITKRKGLINSTWLLYKKGSDYYFFDINQKVEFNDIYKYSEIELLNEFEHSSFEVDTVIS